MHKAAECPGLDPASLVSNYAGACRLGRGNLEIILLYRSVTITDLKKNANVMIGIYRGICPKAQVSADSGKASHKKAKKWSGHREDRQNGTHNGRNYNKR